MSTQLSINGHTFINPTTVQQPAFLMSAPFSYATDAANNAWMRDLEDAQRQPDMRRAFKQFFDLYNFIASDALVYLLPSPSQCGLQDLVFTANLGAVLQHMPSKNVVVLSNFTSEPRIGETAVGREFFAALGYEVFVPPFKFEGEAELKHLHDNVYVGGYGERSEERTYEWMRDQFGMEIIPLELVDPYLYHLDCSIFPIDRETTMVCTEMFESEELAELEQYTDIVDVSADSAYSGICNCVRLGNTIMNASNIHDLERDSEDYAFELSKNRALEDIVVSRGFELSLFNLSEYLKGGALLSCMIMHLNRASYEISLC